MVATCSNNVTTEVAKLFVMVVEWYDNMALASKFKFWFE